MATVIILAVGALVVMFMAGLSGAVPGPDNSHSKKLRPSEPASRGLARERLRLPVELLDALANPGAGLGGPALDEPRPAAPSREGDIVQYRTRASHHPYDEALHDD